MQGGSWGRLPGAMGAFLVGERLLEQMEGVPRIMGLVSRSDEEVRPLPISKGFSQIM